MEMARNSMGVARMSAEVTGHNLANAANPGYARQRVKVESASSLPTTEGPQGGGARVDGFEQIRDKTLDKYLVTENSLTGYYETKKQVLNQSQVRLGQILDRQSVDPKSGNSHQTGLAERITDFFNTFQSLSAAPTSNTERRLAVVSATELADRFNRAHDRLSGLREDVNSELKDGVAEVNKLLQSISVISQRIGASESGETGMANELRDTRQRWFEELAEQVDFNYTENQDGQMNLTVGGHKFIDEDTLVDQFAHTVITDNPTAKQAGMTYIKSISGNGLLNITSGKMKGLIDARDDTIFTLVNDINEVAKQLINEVNAVHYTGYDLNGAGDNTLKFFTGTGSNDMKVNQTLIDNPQRIQASGYANEPGDNTVGKQIANLMNKNIAALNSVTFNESYSNSVARFGQAISNVETQLEAQEAVQRLLEKQRDSVSGVSIDEEVSNLMMYQRAFQASARLITTMDTLLEDVLTLQR